MNGTEQLVFQDLREQFEKGFLRKVVGPALAGERWIDYRYRVAYKKRLALAWYRQQPSILDGRKL